MIKILYLVGLLIYISIIALLIFIIHRGVKNKVSKFSEHTRRSKKKALNFKYRVVIEFIILMLGLTAGIAISVPIIQKKLLIPKDAILYIRTNEMWTALDIGSTAPCIS